MPLMKYRATLTQYLIGQRRRHPEATGEFNDLILAVAQACKAIARSVAHGSLRGVGQELDTVNVQGEGQKALDVIANDIFVKATEWEGVLSGVASEEMDEPLGIPDEFPRGKYLLVFDPLDGSSNIEVNVSVGSIFSVLRSPRPGEDPIESDFLQPGTEQVAAGYAIYGPSTMLVLTVGEGVVGFTLDPELGEFLLTHTDIRVPDTTCEFAINTSNSRFWEAPVRRYVEECLAGQTGPRGKDFNMRWIASLVAEAHRVLMRGGVFLYPRDTKDAEQAGSTAAALRVQPHRDAHRAGRRAREHRRDAGPGGRADLAAPAHRVRVRLGCRSRDDRALPPHHRARRRRRDAAVQHARPLPPTRLTC